MGVSYNQNITGGREKNTPSPHNTNSLRGGGYKKTILKNMVCFFFRMYSVTILNGTITFKNEMAMAKTMSLFSV